jgi:hypothetical protein
MNNAEIVGIECNRIGECRAAPRVPSTIECVER